MKGTVNLLKREITPSPLHYAKDFKPDLGNVVNRLCEEIRVYSSSNIIIPQNVKFLFLIEDQPTLVRNNF
jgi:hypothetical protein